MNNLHFIATIQHYVTEGAKTVSEVVERRMKADPVLPEFVLNRVSNQVYSFISGRSVKVPIGVRCEEATNLPKGGYWIAGNWAGLDTDDHSDSIMSWRDTYGFWVPNEYVTKL